MSRDLDNSRQGSVVASLVSLAAAVACVLASDARASRPQTEPSVDKQELSARVATIVERMRVGDPTVLRDLRTEKKVAQWSNR